MQSIFLNEPDATFRRAYVFLEKLDGTGQTDLTGITITYQKPGSLVQTNVTGNFVSQGDGQGYIPLATTDVDTAGNGWVKWSGGSILSSREVIEIRPYLGAARYFKATGGTSASISLDASAEAVLDGFYASGTSPASVMIISGTGAGQSRLATGYVAASKQLTVSPAWSTTPDTTSIAVILPPSSGSGGGGSGGTAVVDTAAVASAVLDFVLDPNAPVDRRTVKHILNLMASEIMGQGDGYPFSVQQTITKKSLGGDKTRLKTTISGGRRTTDTADGT